MPEKIVLSWTDVENYVKIIVERIQVIHPQPDLIVGIKRGGVIPAFMIAKDLQVPFEVFHPWQDEDRELMWKLETFKRVMFIDDINDSGDTMNNLRQTLGRLWIPSDFYYNTMSLIKRKKTSYPQGLSAVVVDHDDWFVFPWEKDEPPERDYVKLK